MSEFIEARDSVAFQLDGEECVPFHLESKERLFFPRPYDLGIEAPKGWSRGINFGDFVGEDWEAVRPYPTNPFSDEIDPTVLAVLVKRSKRYRTALAARDFIEENDLHEESGPVDLGGLFRSTGGTVIQPGGLSGRDAERFPGRIARIHGLGDITLFLQEGDDEVRRRELMALTIAVHELRWDSSEDGYAHGPLDLSLGDARHDHMEAHIFASMMLVPQADAARAIDIAMAEAVGQELKVDSATVQDAHQLWNEVTHPERPKS